MEKQPNKKPIKWESISDQLPFWAPKDDETRIFEVTAHKWGGSEKKGYTPIVEVVDTENGEALSIGIVLAYLKNLVRVPVGEMVKIHYTGLGEKVKGKNAARVYTVCVADKRKLLAERETYFHQNPPASGKYKLQEFAGKLFPELTSGEMPVKKRK